MQNESLSEKQSLEIIEDMIHTAKQEQTGAAYYLTIWGTLTGLYCLSLYIGFTYKLEWLSYAWILFPIGGLLSVLRNRKDEKEEKAKAFSDRLYGFTWGGLGFCAGIIMIFGTKLGIDNVMPVIILLYALAAFITGGVTKYYPSIIGAVLCALCSIFAFNSEFTIQFLYCAAAMVFACIVPGLMMKGYYKRKVNA
ncbi:MAG: hypothetical protein JST70_10765 [Bacteroidetes bacterium]|nr:hypothetical protein [Bacteroidota bacterium]